MNATVQQLAAIIADSPDGGWTTNRLAMQFDMTDEQVCDAVRSCLLNSAPEPKPVGVFQPSPQPCYPNGEPVGMRELYRRCMDRLFEVSPPGFSGTTKAMKDRHPEIKNPWALAWYMYKQGAKPHVEKEPGKPRYVTPKTRAKRKALQIQTLAKRTRQLAASDDTVSTNEAKPFDTSKEHAQDWKPFLLDYVIYHTRTKKQRELVDGYQVRKVRGKYTVYLNGKPSPAHVPVSDAIDSYERIRRTPLSYLLKKADELRHDIFKESDAAMDLLADAGLLDEGLRSALAKAGAWLKGKGVGAKDALRKVAQELGETGRAAKILAKAAAGRKLTDEEGAFLKDQAKDVLRGLGMGAVVALPGGAALAYLLMKVSPVELRPSAFREVEESLVFQVRYSLNESAGGMDQVVIMGMLDKLEQMTNDLDLPEAQKETLRGLALKVRHAVERDDRAGATKWVMELVRQSRALLRSAMRDGVDEAKVTMDDLKKYLVPRKSIIINGVWYTVRKRSLKDNHILLAKASWEEGKTTGIETDFNMVLKKVNAGTWGMSILNKGHIGADSPRFGKRERDAKEREKEKKAKAGA